jgi:hypothetical protein
MFRPLTSRWLLTVLSCALLLASARNLRAQTETWQPATTGFATEIKVWARSNGAIFANVRLTYPSGGWRMSSSGSATRAGNNLTVEAQVERWGGITTQAITYSESTYSLGVLPPGSYTFTFKSFGVVIKSYQFNTASIAERWEPTTVSGDRVGIRIWSFDNGRTVTKVELYFPDTGYGVADWGRVTRSGNEFSVDVKAERWTGETEARTRIEGFDYELGTLSPGSYSLVVKNYGTTLRTQAFSVQAANPAMPSLLTEDNSERAVALDSVTWLRLFPIDTSYNFSTDRRARVVLFLKDVQWPSGENRPEVWAQAEDAQGTIHTLPVEYVGRVPNFDWLTQVIVMPPMLPKDSSDVWVKMRVNGVFSNRALLSIKPSGAN